MTRDVRLDALGVRARRRMESRRATRRSIVLTLLGTLIPGAGLIPTRYRRLGWLVLGVLVASILVLAGMLLVKGPTALALAVAVNSNALLIAAGVIALLTLAWLFTIVLTHRGTDDPRLDRVQRGGLRAFTAVMCLVVAVPMATAVRYSLIQRDIVGTLFGSGRDGNGALARPGEGPDPWEGVARVNLLLIGSDAGDDRIGVRTDSMIVASINPQTGDSLMFSLPRNLEKVPFPKSNPLYKLWPNGYNCGSDCLLNAVWAEAAVNHKELFKGDKNPGLTTVRGVIEQITGLRMDYTTVVDLKGFQALVDAMGGVVVTVTEDLPIGGHVASNGQLIGVTGWVHKGTQRLDGYNALWFARSRILSDDYNRMRRQRCLVGKILDQVNPATMLQKYPELAQVAKDNIQTDIPAADLPAWVDLVGRIKGASIRSLTFTDLNTKVYDPDFPKMRTMIQDAIYPELATTSAPPTTTGPTKSGKATSTKTSTKSPTTSTSTRTSTSTTTTATTPAEPTSDTLISLKDAC